jgi:glycerol-3-phosphate O-acyltransferase
MKQNIKNQQKGIISSLIMIVAALILIAYFRNNITGILNSPGVRDAILTAINWIRTALIWIVDKLGWTSSQIK